MDRTGAPAARGQQRLEPIPDSRFEVRRAAIWQGNRHWLLASAASLALLAVLAGLDNVTPQLAGALIVAAAATIGVTIARLVRALNALYLCPNCGAQPYQTLNEYKCGGLGPTRANFMSPTHCPKCGTRLR